MSSGFQQGTSTAQTRESQASSALEMMNENDKAETSLRLACDDIHSIKMGVLEGMNPTIFLSTELTEMSVNFNFS